MENELEVTPKMNAQGQAAAMAQIAMVREQMRIAKEFPRDFADVHTKVMKACSRKALAEVAVYKYPRANQSISGPSIRMAEVLAQNYGNMDFGVRELSQQKGSSVVESYCIDLETNVRSSKTFEVPHSVQLKGGKIKILTDQRDIYEHAANYGARRLRACILQCLPGDLVEAAVSQCKKTVVGNVNAPIEDRIRLMITGFDTRFQINAEMIENHLGREIKTINHDDLFDLQTIFTSLKDGQSKRSDWFKVKDDGPKPDGVTDMEEAIDTESETIEIKPAPTPLVADAEKQVENSVEKPVDIPVETKPEPQKKAPAKKKSSPEKVEPPIKKKEKPLSPIQQQFNEAIKKEQEKNKNQ